MTLIAEELEWYEFGEAELFGTVIIDTDPEFSGIVFAADLAEKFRWIGQTPFFGSIDEARSALMEEGAEALAERDARRDQGDERDPVDFLTPVVPDEQLNPHFSVNSSLETDGCPLAN